MKELTIDDVKVTITNVDDMSYDEAAQYLKKVQKDYPNEKIKELNITLNKDGKIELDTRDSVIPFERIRRITGYLVGTLDRFNDAKRAEESQRVKHSVDGLHGGGGGSF